jgi:anti-sigma regulatory factor (Ser/Thr protein kinase)
MTLAIPVAETSQVGGARRAAAKLASQIAMAEVAAARLGIVVTELAANAVHHGGGGEVLLSIAEQGEAIEVLVLDRGPGMENVDRCLEDGYSSRGTPGTGLGAARRQADLFDIHSQPGQGTAVLARVCRHAAAKSAPAAPSRLGAICLPKPGEDACGDAWGMLDGPAGRAILVADGLGHGPQAADASGEALRLFLAAQVLEPAEIMRRLHAGLRHTRGGALAAALIEDSRVRFSGIGNIAGALVTGGETRRMLSHNGTAGHVARTVQEFHYPLTAPGLLILHSDGIATSWSMDRYRGLAPRHPTLIAAVLFRDHARGRDDATVVVARVAPGAASAGSTAGAGASAS